MLTNKLRIAALAAGIAMVPSIAAAAASAIVTTDLNIRTGPSTAYPAFDVIPSGDDVTVYGCVSGYDWCDVGWEGYRGWVSSDYLAYLGDRYYREPIASIGVAIGLPIFAYDRYAYYDRWYDDPYYDRWIRREIREDRRDFRRAIREDRREARQERREERRELRRERRQDRRDARREQRQEARQEQRQERAAERRREQRQERAADRPRERGQEARQERRAERRQERRAERRAERQEERQERRALRRAERVEGFQGNAVRPGTLP